MRDVPKKRGRKDAEENVQPVGRKKEEPVMGLYAQGLRKKRTEKKKRRKEKEVQLFFGPTQNTPK